MPTSFALWHLALWHGSMKVWAEGHGSDRETTYPHAPTRHAER